MAVSAGAGDVLDLIRKSDKPHPRLFISEADEQGLRKKIKSEALLNRVCSRVIEEADSVMLEKPVEYNKIGRRLLHVSRQCCKRVVFLSYAYRHTGDRKYAERAQKEMLAAARFSDWNPEHFLDVAEMTAGLAIGYDWCYDALDPEARDEIRKAIIAKGLETSLEGGWWVSARNNWNQVCHGGLTLGALAVMEDEPELAAQIIERAVKNLPVALAEYAPDGAYPEGPGYWNYGTSYSVLFFAATESVLGTDFGLMDSEGFLESSDYYQHAAGPTGLYFNYSDGRAIGGFASAMFWFAGKRGKTSLVFRQKQLLDEIVNRKDGKSMDSFFPLAIDWAPSLKKISAPKELDYKADGGNPIAIFRSGWDNNAVYAGFKGGTPSANHGHMDIGSFVMDADGVRWAVDLGSQDYYSLESMGVELWNGSQNGQRWDVFRLNNFSHNTLVVDGRKQVVSGFAPLTRFSAGKSLKHAVIDMGKVYGGQFASSKRGLALAKDRSITVQDELKTLDKKTSVRWGMVTHAEVRILSDSTALLKQDGEMLALAVISPENAKLEIYNVENPPNDYDEKNKNARMIGFTVDIPASTESTFTVLLRPGGREINKKHKTRPLSEW